jgi:adenylate cyclase
LILCPLLFICVHHLDLRITRLSSLICVIMRMSSAPLLSKSPALRMARVGCIAHNGDQGTAGGGGMAIQVCVSNRLGISRFEHATGSLEFGREPRTGVARKVVDDPYISKDQLRVEELHGNRLRVENLSGKVSVRAADGTVIGPGETHALHLPARLTVGMSLIEVSLGAGASDEGEPLRTVARPDLRPGVTLAAVRASLDDAEATGSERLALWFETLLSVQRAAACSAEFYQEIARALVDLIGLDRGLFLKREADGWTPLARYPVGDSVTATYSQTVLDRVCLERRTFYRALEPAGAVRSLTGVTTVVASPVLDAAGEAVVGVVYGVMTSPGTHPGGGFSPLHAQLVQVLAAAATAGIARLGSEAEAARRHVQFEQFFSRELAGELDRDPELLAGQDREVTVLVSDVRSSDQRAARPARDLPPHGRRARAAHRADPRGGGGRGRLRGRRHHGHVERTPAAARPRRPRLPRRTGHAG